MLERYGDLRSLQPRRIPLPEVKTGCVLVRIAAASLNDWEVQMHQGEVTNRLFLGWRRPRRPVVPGCDIAGTVVAVADGASAAHLEVGDRVYGDLSGAGFGALAEFAAPPASQLARIPDGMSDAQAAAIPQAGTLAWQGLFDSGDLQGGERLLLNGAGGGVGTFALQLARIRSGVEHPFFDSTF